MSRVKEEVLKLIAGLPDGISRDVIIYQRYVRKKFERGIEAADEGRVATHDEVKKQFLSK